MRIKYFHLLSIVIVNICSYHNVFAEEAIIIQTNKVGEFTLFKIAGRCHPLTKNVQNQHKNNYDSEYGHKWIYFPDGDDIPHYVNLSISQGEIIFYPRTKLNFAMEYRLYTRNNTETYITLDEAGNSPYESNVGKILKDVPLKIVTHGWRSTADKSAVINIKNAYLNSNNVNVIAIDWSAIANIYFYPWVAYETAYVGSRVGLFLDSLNYRYNVTGDQIHLIGHSLGAHVLGVAAFNSFLEIFRITGLDPALPLFENRDSSLKLDSGDAIFVDVIHTCGGILGVQHAIGKADFFPNSGTSPQPGCESVQKMFEACSHSRSNAYYAESIKNPKSFPAYQCNSWADFLKNKCKLNGYMGEGANSKNYGKFYLKTNAKEPYGQQ